MNRVILCEGKTDAILLGYYLGKIAGWKHSKSTPSDLKIRAHEQNENVAWYNRDSEWLMICAVGGKDNFGKFFSKDIQKAIINANKFSRIAVIVDRDEREVEEIERSVCEELSPFFGTVKNRQWNTCGYTDGFGMEKTLESMLLVIPTDQQGALETVMLSAISEDPYDKNIVDQCSDFVEGIKDEADRYITTERLLVKAKLSTVWAIQSPQKVFEFIDEQIKAVEWEKSEVLRECFVVLESI